LMRVVLLYNEPLPSRYDALGEGVAVASVMDAVIAIETELKARGHVVRLLGLQPPLSNALKELDGLDADAVFNLFEGFDGQPDTEIAVAKALNSRSFRFTGASARTLALCLDKAKAKSRLMECGVSTLPFQMLGIDELERFRLQFPVIVKPNGEDASHGINVASVVYDMEALSKQLTAVQKHYGGVALVESFLTGREFNASILGGSQPRVLPPSEIVYTADMPEPRILTYAAKWLPEDSAYRSAVPVCPAQVAPHMLTRIEEVALAAHKAVGSPPYGRVDLRGDTDGDIYVLEVNPNPDLSPDAGMALQAGKAGMSYGGLIETLLCLAVQEPCGDARRACAELAEGQRNVAQPCFDARRQRNVAQRRQKLPELTLRAMEPDEVDKLVALTEATGFFHQEEVCVAREVLTEAVSKGEDSGYIVCVAGERGDALGYVCFGPTPLTRGTWDIYWLAVHPEYQRRGIGKSLIRQAEAEIRRNQGRLAVVETSSQDLYLPTRQFYINLGYQEVCCVPDFYDIGDDKIVYTKLITTGGSDDHKDA
jgi:D-alanine-D-alanine ligase